MKAVKIFVLVAVMSLLAGVCFAGPVQVDGDITIKSKNSGDVVSIAGGKVDLGAFGLGPSGQIGSVKNTRTNVGGVNLKSNGGEINIGKTADIVVESENSGTAVNVGTDMNVGGLNIDAN